MKLKSRISFVLMLLLSFSLYGQNLMNLITYGSDALPAEGDDDHKQIVFIKVPADSGKIYYVKIFDPDCGGDFDDIESSWDTKTRFTIYGGADAVSAPTLTSPFPDSADFYSGKIISSSEFSDEIEFNAEWFTLSKILSEDGERIGDYFYFKILVEGLSGDDGNIFNVAASDAENINLNSKNAELFTYNVSLRLSEYDNYASIKFFVPDRTTGVGINYFDVMGSKLSFETPFRSIPIPNPNVQGKWLNKSIDLEEIESGSICEIKFGQGAETPNDATFYVSVDNFKAAPIFLPIYNGLPNNRPKIRKTITKLSDCYSLVLDASRSTDKDGDDLQFTWLIDNVDIAQKGKVVYKFPERKEYEITVIVKDNSGQVGNSSYDKFNVVINQTPKPVIENKKVAAPGEKIEFSAASSFDPDGKIKSYSWNFGDNTSSTGKIVSHSYSSPGIYNIQLILEDDSDSPCNSSSVENSIRINEKPAAAAGPDRVIAAGEKVLFDAGGSYDPDGKIISYKWTFNNRSVTNQKAAFNFDKPGKYKVTLTVNDGDNVGNSLDSDFVTVVVNFPPAAAAGEDKTAAEGEIVIFDGSKSYDKDGIIRKYEWDFGDGTKAFDAYIAHSYSRPGKYRAKLTVTDNSNTASSSSSDERIITVNAAPVARAGTDTIITTSVVKLDGSQSSDPDGSIAHYFWDFGDGSTSDEVKPAHVYSSPGVYKIKLVVTDNTETSNNKDSDEITVIVNENPVADAGPNKFGTPNQVFTFDASNSFDPDGEIINYIWEFGDSESAEGITVKHAYKKPGKYTVRLTVKDNTGGNNAVDFSETHVVINSPPIADAGEDIIAAPGDEVVLSARNSKDPDGSIISYTWDVEGIGNNIRSKEVKGVYKEPGYYKAVLRVKDNSNLSNSIASDVCRIKINNRPIARAGKDIFTCDEIISFDASGSADSDGDPLSYKWDFGDGSKSVFGAKVMHDFLNGGSYPVTLTVDDGLGLSNSVSVSSIVVKINEPPKADAGADRIICAGDVSIFDGSKSFDPENGFLAYYWDFGDGTKASGINTSKSYNKGGIYQVTLKVEDDSGLPCSSGIDRMVVKVVESPVAEAGEDKIVCANSEVKFDGSKSTDFDGVVNSYYWDFGDGKNGGGSKPTHIYEKAGIYKVTLTITGDETPGCDNSDTDELTVNVIEAPTADFISEESVPVGVSLAFDASPSSGEGSQIVSYQWDFGDGEKTSGIDAAGKNVEHAFNKYGKYIVALEISTNSGTNCNRAVKKKLITVNEPPTAIAGDDIKTGVNLSVSFNASSSMDADGSIASYLWDFGDGTRGATVNPTHKYSNFGKYQVILKVTDNTSLPNNFDFDTLFVMVNETPKPVITSPDKICVGETANFDAGKSMDADGEIVMYLWDFGDGIIKTGKSVQYSYREPGIYDLKLEVKDNSGVTNDSQIIAKQISVNSPPSAKAFNAGIVCPGENVEFDAGNSTDIDNAELTYRWDFGDGTTGGGISAAHRYSAPGIYTAVLTVNDNSGTDCDTDSFELKIKVNSPPVIKAKIEGDYFAGGAHDALLFDASDSYDPDGDPIEFYWDFGDGGSATGAKLFHKYLTPGNYKAVLTVKDNNSTDCSVISQEFSFEIKSR